MAGPNSDSDAPPDIPDEEYSVKFKVVQKTLLQTNNNVRLPVNQSTPLHGTLFTAARRPQSFSLSQPVPAAETTGSQHKGEPDLSMGSQQEELCSAASLEDDHCVLRATPERLEFELECSDHYSLEAAKPLRREIVLQNVSNYTVSFVVLPPSSKAFSLSCPQKKPFLSAGMQQRVQISFRPDVCAPQSDFIKVVISIRSVEDMGGAFNRKQAICRKRLQDSLLLKRIPLRAVVHYKVRDKNPVTTPATEFNANYDCQTTDEFVPFSVLSCLDFGHTKLGSVKQRRLVLPAALWVPVEFTVELRRKTSAFSVEPIKGIIGPRDPVSLWLQFSPSLYAEYTDDLLVFLGTSSNPYRVKLIGTGVPLQSPEQSKLIRRETDEKVETSPQLHPAKESEKCCSRTKADKETNHSQHPGQALDCQPGANNTGKKLKAEPCAEVLEGECNINLQESRTSLVSTPHRPKRASRKRECTAKGANYAVPATTATKRLDSSKYGEGVISKQCLDERWADLVAVLRAQKLGTQTVKGTSLPSDATVQKIQLKRAEEVQRMLKLLQIQDRNRNTCTFAGAPVAPSRTATQNTLESTSSSQEAGAVLREQWRGELISRFRQAATRVVLRTRMARRLDAIRTWIRSRSVREEMNQSGVQDKQHQNSQSKRLTSTQYTKDRNIENLCQKGISTQLDTAQQCEKYVNGTSKCEGNATLAAPIGVEASATAGSVESPAGLSGQDLYRINDENRWRVKLVPPRLSLSADSNGEWEWLSIPGPEFWGKENLNVAELFTCMQQNAPLSPLSKRDVDVFRLKEEDVITCTGGLEVTDTDLLQSLLEATPPLIDDKPCARYMTAPVETPDDAKALADTRSISQEINGSLDEVTLLPPDDPNGLAKVAWRFVAPVAPYSNACMQLPPIVETDLAYVFLQAAAHAKTNHVTKNIFPPFAEVPPLRCNISELTAVTAAALWPPGAHQRSLRVPPCNFDEQGCDKRREPSAMNTLEPSLEKDAHALALEECVDRAQALRNDSKVLANIWGLARCEQVELLNKINKTLPQEFQIPYL